MSANKIFNISHTIAFVLTLIALGFIFTQNSIHLLYHTESNSLFSWLNNLAFLIPLAALIISWFISNIIISIGKIVTQKNKSVDASISEGYSGVFKFFCFLASVVIFFLLKLNLYLCFFKGLFTISFFIALPFSLIFLAMLLSYN